MAGSVGYGKFKIAISSIHQMNFRKLDLNLLLVFDAVYKEGSITKAADRLGLSQPAVSNALNRLRQHLDDPLFHRGPGGMEATPLSRRIAPSVMKSLRSVEESLSMNTDFDPRTSAREFTILIADAIEPLIMYPLLKRRAQEMPGITFNLRPVIPEVMAESVSNKDADIAAYVISFNENGVRSNYLCTTSGSIIVRKGHPAFQGRERVTMDDLAENEWATLGDVLRKTTRIDQALNAHGLERKIVCKVPRIWSLGYMVANSDVIAALPTYMAEMLADKIGLDVFPYPFVGPDEQWFLSWHEDYTNDPAHQWLRQTLLDVAKPMA